MSPLLPFMRRTIEDIQDRLLYRAQITIRDEVATYEVDVDYGKDNTGKDGKRLFPSLERCLLLLSRLFRHLTSKSAFELIAQDAVTACIKSLQHGMCHWDNERNLRGAVLIVLDII
jgi:hypothetical protein